MFFSPSPTLEISPEQVRECLKQVIDPELNVDIVSLGLIYAVDIKPRTEDGVEVPFIHILMTLTTPGCPLAGVFDPMVRDALRTLPNVDVENHVWLELTFDPPWVPDMMSEEARAELGFD